MAQRSGRGHGFLLGAAAVGLVHAGFSLYWAGGGRWLLNTVGQWAVSLATRNAVGAGLVLAIVALVKVAGALVPLGVEAGRVPGRRFWRRLEAIGAIVLVAYGALNVTIAWAVLGGLITPTAGYDRAAELGHAALWDPLFLLWGVLLGAGLWLTRAPVLTGDQKVT